MASKLAMASQVSRQVSMPSSEAALKGMSESERLMQAAHASEAADSAMGTANRLKEKAGWVTDPKKREDMMREAYNRELEAHGNSKKARVLKSGTFQGAASGAGIGAATGLGLGTVVGTVVGGVASIPTTLVGGLVGSGIGVIHGPWIKFEKWTKGDSEGDEQAGDVAPVEVPIQAVETGAVTVDEKTGHVQVKDPKALEKATKETKAAEQGATRRKPRKIEVRPKKVPPAGEQDKQTPAMPATPATQTSSNAKQNQQNQQQPPKRKPPKIEIRSSKPKPAAP